MPNRIGPAASRGHSPTRFNLMRYTNPSILQEPAPQITLTYTHIQHQHLEPASTHLWHHSTVAYTLSPVPGSDLGRAGRNGLLTSDQSDLNFNQINYSYFIRP